MQLTHLGPYKIEKPLGKGGMGSVYEATDSRTGQRVAIKALSPHLAVAEGFRERFEGEIESLKTLRHEGIVRLYGYGEQDGVLFYSMELVEGTSLEDELRAGRRFDWREVTNIAIQLSRALKHAHDHGIVHRDIKPANILLYEGLQVKLADFGIARLFGSTQLTTAGGVLGTADYMSPEQAEGRPITARCDQYSLGGVMYALLTGRPPFLASSLPQMLQLQRFAEPEPVRRFARDVPEQLERVILQLLSKDPGQRFPNTQVLARHLQAMLRALSRPAADDFALAGEQPAPRASPPDRIADDPDALYSLALEPTKAEGDVARSFDKPGAGEAASGRDVATHDAPTLAAEPAAQSRGENSNRSGGSNMSPVIARAATNRPARFTTVEEDEARRQAEHRRSWLLTAAQLAALVAVLAGILGAVFYLSRPASADDLYNTIRAHAESDQETSLSAVAPALDEFLTRYPDDPRAVEVHRYKERLELDRLERRLQRRPRRADASDTPLLPVEQLYLRAIDAADNSPEDALLMLQSLVDLYGPSASDQESEDDRRKAAVVQLAKRRLAGLQAELAERRERQLAVLRERLRVAEKISETDAARAAAMYRAIIDLHQHDDWAAEVVGQARSQLEAMEAKP